MARSRKSSASDSARGRSRPPEHSDPTPSPIILGVSGLAAEVVADRFVPGSFELLVAGTPQSHVNLEDPSNLFFEYVRRIGHVIDLVSPPGAPLTAVHLGGGALTLPRYVEVTRPGSQQQVVELESDLVNLVRERLPLPKRASLRVRHGDAREVLGRLPAGLHGRTDLVIVDIFAGSQTPAHVTSAEFYDLVKPLLSPGGVLVVNAADGPGLAFARGQVATLRSVFPAVAALGESQVMRGKRFGNVVILASLADSFADWGPRLRAAGPHPAQVVLGQEIQDFQGNATAVTDRTAVPSPTPATEVFAAHQKKRR